MLDRRISDMRPGQSIRISGSDAMWVTADRSCDGKTVRFVRHTADTSTVFRVAAF